MKKILATILALTLLLSVTACKTTKTNTETANRFVSELDEFITENGEKDGDNYILDCPEVAEKIKESDFTIASMENLKGTLRTEFKLIKSAEGVSIELIDASISDTGLKMERSILIDPNGMYEYRNGIVMDGSDLGIALEGEIPMESYTKEKSPVIEKSKLATGAKLTDAAKEALKDYVDLALDCYSDAISQKGLKITIADVGYTAYPGNE